MKRLLKITLMTCLCVVMFALLGIMSSAESSTETRSGYDSNWDYYSVSVTYEDEYEFTGKTIKPEYSVKLTQNGEEKVLTKDVDFTESVNNGIYPDDYFCYANLQGIGDYSFNITFYFSVYYDEAKLSVKIPSVTYSGYYPEISPKVTYNSKVVIPSDHYSWDIENYDYKVGTYDANVYIDDITLNSSVKVTAFDASGCTVSAIEKQAYTGSAIEPYMSVTCKVGDYTFYLYQGDDYTVKYSNNKNIGTATAKLTFKGNYKGTKTVSFKIVVGKPDYMSVSSSNKTNSIYAWSYSKHTYLYVYRYNSDTKKYEYTGKTDGCYYNDTISSQLTTYKYAVKCVLVLDGKKYSSEYVYGSVKSGLFSPTVSLTTKKGSVKVAWTKNTKATGYEVYRYDTSTGKTKKLSTISKNTTLTYTDKTGKDYYCYLYYVLATKGSVKSAEGDKVASLDPSSILRGVKLSSKKSYNVYDTQGSKRTKYRTVTLSTADINTLKKFAKNNFKSGWTVEQKVEYTLNWIHNKVTYAYGSNWTKISGKTYVDAIFNYKLGQCAQYNGALAGMMTYLGFDVKLIKGYRSNSSLSYKAQHYWCECVVNGLTYVMETGNHKDGDWWHFFKPYRYTHGYTLNGKYASGDQYYYW